MHLNQTRITVVTEQHPLAELTTHAGGVSVTGGNNTSISHGISGIRTSGGSERIYINCDMNHNLLVQLRLKVELMIIPSKVYCQAAS